LSFILSGNEQAKADRNVGTWSCPTCGSSLSIRRKRISRCHHPTVYSRLRGSHPRRQTRLFATNLLQATLSAAVKPSSTQQSHLSWGRCRCEGWGFKRPIRCQHEGARYHLVRLCYQEVSLLDRTTGQASPNCFQVCA
jgi:hypothetical protein